MTTFDVMTKHRLGNLEVETCRCGSAGAAEDIAAILRSERFVDKHPDDKRGRNVPRYESVRVEEITT